MQTEKILTINKKDLRVRFAPFIVRLINDDELSALLNQDTETATNALVQAIKLEFANLYKREISISDASMAVEIWGHVYAEAFAEAIKKLSPIHAIQTLAEKIVDRCEVIDMGESGHDNNRFVWDALSNFKSAIALLLPGSKEQHKNTSETNKT